MLAISSTQEKTLWLLLVAFVLIYTAILTWASQVAPTDPRSVSAAIAITFMIAAGIAFMGIPKLIALANDNKRPLILALILIAGFGARMITFGGEAFFENDHFRYLWDGAVLANGLSPWGYAPIDVIEPDIVVSEKINQLIALSMQSTGVMEHINYPFLSTIYPSVAQVFFAFAYLVEAFSLNAWRLVLLIADLVNLVLIIAILRNLGRSTLWAAIYWLNPLVIGEFFNSAHVDLLIFPFLLFALLLVSRRWTGLSLVFLALATAVKVWPILLFPLFIRPLMGQNLRKGLMLTFGFVALVTLLFWPMIVEQLASFGQGGTGLGAYSQTWTMNDSFYQVVVQLVKPFAYLFTGDDFVGTSNSAHLAARTLIALAVGTLAVLIALPTWRDLDQLLGRCLFLVAVMFIFSPTQFPWYYVWLVPFLAFRPTPALLILTVTMPLYYTRFLFDAMTEVWIYDLVIVWFIWVPSLLIALNSGFAGMRALLGRGPKQNTKQA